MEILKALGNVAKVSLWVASIGDRRRRRITERKNKKEIEKQKLNK